MYLHIGNNNVIYEKSIIGIFSIDSLIKNNLYEKFINSLKKENKVINVSNDNEEKTLILVNENNIIKAYISNISSITLANRK